jgi:hypothetical protein
MQELWKKLNELKDCDNVLAVEFSPEGVSWPRVARVVLLSFGM